MAHETGCTTGDPCISARALSAAILFYHIEKIMEKNNYSTLFSDMTTS